MANNVRFWNRIRWNLIALSMFLTYVPVAIVALVVVPKLVEREEARIFGHLESIATLKLDQIDQWIENTRQNMALAMARDPFYDALIAVVTGSSDNQTLIRDEFTHIKTIYPIVEEFFVYDLDGKVRGASDEREVGKILTLQPFFRASLIPENHYLFHAPFYDVSTSNLLMFLTHPLIDANDQPVGAVAIRLNANTLNEIMTQRSGFPETGETLLVSNENNYLLTVSRFEGYENLRFYPDFAQRTGSGHFTDYRDVPILGVYRQVPLLAATLAAEVDVSEALTGSTQAQNTGLFIAFIAAVVAGFFGFLYATWFARPITTMTRVANALAGGNYNERIPVHRSNEIGQLARAFNTMADELANKIHQLEQFNNLLETRVSERTRDVNIAVEVSQQITTILQRDQLLKKLVELTCESFGFYQVGVYIYSPQAGKVIFEVGAGQVGMLNNGTKREFGLDDDGLIPLAAKTREIVVANDVRNARSYFADPLLPETVSEVVLPMIVGNDLIGVLDLQSRRLNRFQETDLHVLSNLTAQMAIAIRNAQLFEELEKAKQEAEKANQLKSKFLANMSHELRTPLNAILNFSEFVADGTMGEINKKQKDLLMKVIDSGRHLLDLINDILDMSKIEAGMLKLLIDHNISLSDEVNKIVPIAQTLVRGKPVEVVVEVSDQLPLVDGDRQRLRQVMLNLISNACKFTDSGSIALRLNQNGNAVVFSVTDTGPGIAPEDQALVFETFQQTKVGIKKIEGTGLGLAISRHLAEAHQGKLWLESVPGKGSTFYLSLPVRQTETVVWNP